MIPKQKFMVGEPVAVYGILASQWDTDKTEVVKAEYMEGYMMNNDYGAPPQSGWRYQTAHQPDNSKWWREESLVKLKPEGKSFYQMMKDLNRETV